MDDVLSVENQLEALAFFRARGDSAGPDGMRVSDLDEWWTANGERVIGSIYNGSWRPGVARCFEVVSKSGKRREVASINACDRFIEKLMERMLCLHLNPLFSPNSFAYQVGKSALDAVMKARDYVTEGNAYVAEIDLADYFNTIDIGVVETKLSSLVNDERVLSLVDMLLRREVMRDGRIARQEKGLLQGASMSPVLSNLYLRDFDSYMDEEGYSWIRFSDNICVYDKTIDESARAYSAITELLEWEHGVQVNERKSGIYLATERRLLGYDLIERNGVVEVCRHVYQPVRRHDRWHASSVYKDHDSYHILQDGVINRQDYSLLFENEDERHHIPVEVTSQINVYSDVTISPQALATLCEHDIRVAFVDRYGDLLCTCVPAGHARPANVFLAQCRLYTSDDRRLRVAKELEEAGINNMRANLRYYMRHGHPAFKDAVDYLSSCMQELEEAESVEGLRLIEARARKRYYAAFAEILVGTDFDFAKRTRRPPRDPGNAMISFGNTVIYNVTLQAIWRTALDPKIGVVHATNRRSYSLNLDLADIFKPLVVDRVVFTLVNRRAMVSVKHFEQCEGGGVLLNREGKRVFLTALEEKLDDTITHNGIRISWRRLISDEVERFQRSVITGNRYKAFKYY